MRSHDRRSRLLVFSMHSDPIIAVLPLQGGATGLGQSTTRPFQTSARLKLSNERRLLQEYHEGTACGTLELLGVNRAIIVGVGSVEAFLNEREKFIFVQSSVVIGVGRSKILSVDPPAQFAFIEGAV